MKPAEQEIVELGHSIDSRSTQERIRIYRALASTTSRPALAEHFFACADDLAAAEEKIGQRSLNFGKSDQS